MQELYFPISKYYRNKFGEKVWKIPVSIATDCPNRRGLKGMETCLFCDVWGSAAYPEQRNQDIENQIREFSNHLKRRYHAHSFLAYFQAYTSTFMGLQKLRSAYDSCLSFESIKGLVIGTRPDCLSSAVLKTWQAYSRKTHVAVELGVQSFFDHHLQFVKRGHLSACSIEAIKTIKSTTDVQLGVHLIFGFPGETQEEIIKTAEMVSSLPIDDVKLHNLHVLKNTGLEKLYRKGQFIPVDLAEYSQKVSLFLQHLKPNVAVHRLAAVSSRWDELVAPVWTRYKMKTHQYILDQMQAENNFQGKCYASNSIAADNNCLV